MKEQPHEPIFEMKVTDRANNILRELKMIKKKKKKKNKEQNVA